MTEEQIALEYAHMKFDEQGKKGGGYYEDEAYDEYEKQALREDAEDEDEYEDARTEPKQEDENDWEDVDIDEPL